MIHLPANTQLPTWDILVSILLVIVLVLLIIELYISISETGTVFFHSFWNILDVCIVPLFALNYIFSMEFKVNLKFNIEHDLRSGQDKFFYFGWLEYYAYPYYLLFCILFICCSIKPFKYCIHTLQVLSTVTSIRSAWHFIFKIMLFVIPFLYIQCSVIDSLLSNSQLLSNRFPLVNKVGLKNYSNMFIFPEKKFLPYIYCQLCSLVIGLVSVFIAHHYRITKNSSLLASEKTDLLLELKEWIYSSGKRRPQLSKLSKVPLDNQISIICI